MNSSLDYSQETYAQLQLLLDSIDENQLGSMVHKKALEKEMATRKFAIVIYDPDGKRNEIGRWQTEAKAKKLAQANCQFGIVPFPGERFGTGVIETV